MGRVQSSAPIARYVNDFTANGTWEIDPGFAVAKVSFTAMGVGGTPSAWDVDVDGMPWRDGGATAVELDGHNNGVESLGATVNKDVTGVVTAIDVVLASLNLNGATSLRVEVVCLGH